VLARVFLAVSALLWLPYGLFCLVQPGALAGIAGVAAGSPTGSAELRAMYGGLQAGLGALCAGGALRPGLARPALLALAFLGGGLGIARLAGAAIDGAWSPYTRMGLALEWTTLALAVALLRRPGAAAAGSAA
jgi:hypothetical protein